MSDPFPEKIVRERLPMGSAVYLVRLLPFVYFGGMGLLAIFLRCGHSGGERGTTWGFGGGFRLFF